MAKSIEELESEKSRLAEEMRQVDYELALRRGIPMTAEALKASQLMLLTPLALLTK